jgi:rod shape determining protein RodA
MLGTAMVPPWFFWRNMAVVGYSLALALLVLVEFIGVERNGSHVLARLRRWIYKPPS